MAPRVPTMTTMTVDTADILMDSQKLIWVKRMKEGATTEVLKESGEFQQKLESVLAQIANDEKELSSIRYRAKSMLIHPYRWNPEISHPTSYPTFCYPFYGTYIFIP